MPTCRQCSSAFDITSQDLAFYEKVSPVFGGKKESVSPPTLCPDCRQQRRLSWRNELKLYHRSCDACGGDMISLYPPESPFRVFHSHEWWSDVWDPLDHGLDFNPSKPFSSQLAALQRNVPRVNIFNKSCENSDFANHSRGSKNCFYGCAVLRSQDVLYSRRVFDSSNLCDCFNCYASELCYGCSDCTRCYRCNSCRNCTNCTDTAYCYECIGCHDCLLCANLRNKHHHILNIAYSPEEYEQVRQQYERKGAEKLGKLFEEMLRSIIHRNVSQRNCEYCSGDELEDSKDCSFCFSGMKLESCAHCYEGEIAKSCMDCHSVGSGAELDMETHGDSSGYLLLAANLCYGSKETRYCDLCTDCTHCFGCIGLRQKKFCILNRQYSKEEYEQLVPEIIEHIRNTSEWGEFFPTPLSPFAYNETVAQEYYPMTKEEALRRGWKWRDEKDETPKVSKIIPGEQLPDSIADIPDDILNWAIRCPVTKRPFKIVKQELEFYRMLKLPIPRLHPDERHRRRMAVRNPRKLWTRKCAKCGKEMQTTYAPDRPETVYCEACYLKEVY